MSEFVYPLFGPPAIYVEPLVISFTVDPPIAELGSTVASAVLRWTLHKTPLGLQLDGTDIPLNQNVMTVTGPFTAPQTWKLKTSDEKKSDSKKTTLEFQNKMYWQNVTVAPTNSAGILALENSFFLDKLKTKFQMGVPGSLLPCIAYPTRLGAPTRFQIGTPNPNVAAIRTIWTDFTDFTLTTVAFTNASGYTENYYVLIFNGPVQFGTQWEPSETQSLMVRFGHHGDCD